MRICLIGEYSGNLDEGMRKVASHLGKELSKRHQIWLSDLGRIPSTGFFKDIKNFNPQIVHYVPGPSITSFMIMKAVKMYCRDAKAVMSAMHPGFCGLRGFLYGPSYALSSLLKPCITVLKPDLILTQSYGTETMFAKLGCKTMFLPCGVDIEKFQPASVETKRELRHKYELDEREFTVLHIGSVKRRRNIQILQRLHRNNTQILIVGSLSQGIEKKVEHQLEKSGCLVWKEYIENINEVYALADCYVFPTTNSIGSIELPLSVLEAMSCNIPVISTRFGALPRVFEEDDGLIFADKEEDFIQGVERIKNGKEVKNREKVSPYSWEKIASRLEEIYKEMVC